MIQFIERKKTIHIKQTECKKRFALCVAREACCDLDGLL